MTHNAYASENSFEKTPRGRNLIMTRETKVGLLMVALLVGVFGFLVYQKIHRPLEGLANQDSTNAAIQEPDDSPFGNEAQTPRDQERVQSVSDLLRKKRLRDGSENSRLGTDENPRRESELSTRGAEADESFGFSEPIPTPKKTKLPVMLAPDEEPVEPVRSQPSVRTAAARESAREPAEVSFDEFEPTQRKSATRIVQVAQNTEPDPFSGDVADDPQPTETQAGSLPLPVAGGAEANTEDPQFEMPATERTVPPKEARRLDTSSGFDGAGDSQGVDAKSGRAGSVRQSGDFDRGLEAAPRTERRAAPVTFEERRGSSDASPRTAAKGSAPTASGPTYVIQPNDNFWSISRKRYGAGRYYLALAQHNLQAIPDEKRMKPGIEISTPEISVLEQRYAALIPSPAQPDPAPTVVKKQIKKSEDAAPAGFFLSADGTPLYRVGGHDTLTDIAKSHLGRSSRWVQILEMNRNVLQDGNSLKIGTVLKLPADASRVQVVGTQREFR
jgi:nucleoid-associated protein YgaU